jgi:hypothetical protein
MNISKFVAGAVVVVAVGAAIFAAWKFRSAAEMAETRAAAMRRSQEVRARIEGLEDKMAAETKRAEAVESDNAMLASAVQTSQAAVAKRIAAPLPTLTREAFDARVKSAVAKAKDVEVGEALRELLACWELGKTRAGGLEPAHSTQLLGALINLGENYPPALAALREKMEKARKRVLASSDDMEPITELAAIARALKDKEAMVVLYDAIPEGDARRRMVAIYGADGFIAAKRYADVLLGRSWASMSSRFESMRLERPLPRGSDASRAEKIRTMLRSHAVTSAAENIEVLAGGGDLVHARELAGRVLAYDGSEATRALVQKHLERAGQAGLLREVGK